MGAQLITCIVERGKANKVIDVALAAGAQAATFFYGRGRGIREKLGVMGRFILPEKEVVLIVTKEEQTQYIFDSIVQTAELNIEGKGFAYIQPVTRAVGFIE